MIAWKFLAAGAVSPFTRFRWPAPGAWVHAPAEGEHRWVHACRDRDLPYWIAEELWRVELDGPVREAAYQVASPRARLVSRVGAWGPALRAEYARACALRARELVLPLVTGPLRDALQRADLEGLAAAGRDAAPPSRAAEYLADAAALALGGAAAPASYVAAIVATLAGGDGAFDVERAWQARWLAERLAGAAV